jgi:hypothetical protein
MAGDQIGRIMSAVIIMSRPKYVAKLGSPAISFSLLLSSSTPRTSRSRRR